MKSLIICVDRDDDIGRKANVVGPVIGYDRNLETAQKLALADPTDTDVNALYAALKMSNELGLEVVTLTGDDRVGIVSDRKIGKQLDDVMAQMKPETVVFVSDGLDDEQLIPIIQSRVKIDSVNRVVVRQSKELEKAYFKFANFMKEVMADAELARLLFGLPGVILILLAVGGAQALSWIMSVIGAYLIIKGFGWEQELFRKVGGFLKSLSVERISTLLYFIALVTFTLGGAYAYQDLQRSNLKFTDSQTSLNTVGLFILNSSSLNLVMTALGIAILARIIDDWKLKLFMQVRRYFVLAAFIMVIKIILESVANYVVNEEFGFGNFIFSGTIVLLSLAMWIKLTEYFFRPEIKVISRLMRETEGREVANERGEKLGKVTKAVVENLEIKEVHTKKRVFQKKDIISFGDRIIVKTKN